VRRAVFFSMLLALVWATDANASAALVATVGPGSQVTLRSPSGQGIARLPRGTFRIVISDMSRTQNFHLVGPGINKETGIAFVGRTTWTLKFQPGIYRYGSDRAVRTKNFRVVKR
jgi:hypothetical protein